jgi:ribosome-binding protein aMBF1 (putative translation factor)
MCERCAKSESFPVLGMPSDSEAMEFVMSREPKPPKLQMHSNLIDKFNWHLQMARRNSGLTLKQLSQHIKEPEEALKKLESGIELQKPESDKVVGKLEQFFRIKLRKENNFIGDEIELESDVFNKKE